MSILHSFQWGSFFYFSTRHYFCSVKRKLGFSVSLYFTQVKVDFTRSYSFRIVEVRKYRYAPDLFAHPDHRDAKESIVIIYNGSLNSCLQSNLMST